MRILPAKQMFSGAVSTELCYQNNQNNQTITRLGEMKNRKTCSEDGVVVEMLKILGVDILHLLAYVYKHRYMF